MASTNSNKGRAVVLSAACVTMFFISSIALYSVVSKNLPKLGKMFGKTINGFKKGMEESEDSDDSEEKAEKKAAKKDEDEE